METGVEDERPTWMELPPMLYAPAARTDGPDGPEIELRYTGDGSLALLVYTAWDRIRRCCGPYQRWIIISVQSLASIHRVCHFDKILVDVELPEEYRHNLEDLL